MINNKKKLNLWDNKIVDYWVDLFSNKINLIVKKYHSEDIFKKQINKPIYNLLTFIKENKKEDIINQVPNQLSLFNNIYNKLSVDSIKSYIAKTIDSFIKNAPKVFGDIYKLTYKMNYTEDDKRTASYLSKLFIDQSGILTTSPLGANTMKDIIRITYNDVKEGVKDKKEIYNNIITSYPSIVERGLTKNASVLSDLVITNARSYSALAAMRDSGIEEYEIVAILDDRTSEICQFLNGKKLSVKKGLAVFTEHKFYNLSLLKLYRPWGEVKKVNNKDQIYFNNIIVGSKAEDELDFKEEKDLTTTDITSPPYHPHCRSKIVPVFKFQRGYNNMIELKKSYLHNVQELLNNFYFNLDDYGVTLKDILEGIEVEKEHSKNLKNTMKIVLDHLKERKDYYKILKKVMKKSKVFSEGTIRRWRDGNDYIKKDGKWQIYKKLHKEIANKVTSLLRDVLRLLTILKGLQKEIKNNKGDINKLLDFVEDIFPEVDNYLTAQAKYRKRTEDKNQGKDVKNQSKDVKNKVKDIKNKEALTTKQILEVLKNITGELEKIKVEQGDKLDKKTFDRLTIILNKLQGLKGLKGEEKLFIKEEEDATEQVIEDLSYKWARKSSITNLGEDIVLSARHKRHLYESVEDAEKAGQGESFVTRDNLLALNGIDFFMGLTKNNIKNRMILFTLLQHFPKSPNYSNAKPYYGEKAGEIDEAKKLIWEHYNNVFIGVQDIIKKGIENNTNINSIISETASYISNIIHGRGFNSIIPSAKELSDNYFLYPNKQLFSKYYKQLSAATKNTGFLDISKDHRKILTDIELVQNIKNIDENIFKIAQRYFENKESLKDSIKRYTDEGIQKPKQISNKIINLKNVEVTNTKFENYTVEQLNDYLLNTVKVRGIQWGNSVTDEERKEHLKNIATTFEDLSNILNISIDQIAGGQKLAFAIGARGKGSFLAHYEPTLMIINLTRARGTGSVAHEYGHFLDDMIGMYVVKTKKERLENIVKLQNFYNSDNMPADIKGVIKDKSKKINAFFASQIPLDLALTEEENNNIRKEVDKDFDFITFKKNIKKLIEEEKLKLGRHKLPTYHLKYLYNRHSIGISEEAIDIEFKNKLKNYYDATKDEINMAVEKVKSYKQTILELDLTQVKIYYKFSDKIQIPLAEIEAGLHTVKNWVPGSTEIDVGDNLLNSESIKNLVTGGRYNREVNKKVEIFKDSKKEEDSLKESLKRLQKFITTEFIPNIKSRAIKDKLDIPEEKLRNYYYTNTECFARIFETYINKKQKEQKNKNTYLNREREYTQLYPTEAELVKITPTLDSLMQVLREQKILEKSFYINKILKRKEAIMKSKQGTKGYPEGTIHRWRDGSDYIKKNGKWQIYKKPIHEIEHKISNMLKEALKLLGLLKIFNKQVITGKKQGDVEGIVENAEKIIPDIQAYLLSRAKARKGAGIKEKKEPGVKETKLNPVENKKEYITTSKILGMLQQITGDLEGVKKEFGDKIDKKLLTRLDTILGQLKELKITTIKEVTKDEGQTESKQTEPSTSTETNIGGQRPTGGDNGGGSPVVNPAIMGGYGKEYTGRYGKDGILLSRAEKSKIPEKNHLSETFTRLLMKHQQDGVNLAIENFEKGQKGFIIADGTGAGKTMSQLSLAQTMIEKAKKEGKEGPVLIVTKSDAIINDAFTKDAKFLGVDFTAIKEEPGKWENKVYICRYMDLNKLTRSAFPLIIFDESHNLQNAGSQQTKAGIGYINSSKNVVFASATPLDKPIHIKYLCRGLGLKVSKVMDDLGFIYKEQTYGDKTFGTWELKSGVTKDESISRMSAFWDQVTESGNMVKREVSMGNIDFHINKISMEASVIKELSDEFEQMLIECAQLPGRERGAFKIKRLNEMRSKLENKKINATLDMIKNKVKEGKKVVLFATRANASEGDEEDKDTILNEGTLKEIEKGLKEAGLMVSSIYGAVKNKDKQIQNFQNNKSDIIITTPQSGSVGLNLDDRDGTHPRSAIIMTAPFSAKEVIQMLGRINRISTKSKAEAELLYVDTDIEHWNVNILSDKMKLLGATVSGEYSKITIEKLMDSDLEDKLKNYDDIGMIPVADQAPFSSLENLKAEGSTEAGTKAEGAEKVPQMTNLNRLEELNRMLNSNDLFGMPGSWSAFKTKKIWPNPTISFGKHAGKHLSELPLDYLQWMLGEVTGRDINDVKEIKFENEDKYTARVNNKKILVHIPYDNKDEAKRRMYKKNAYMKYMNGGYWQIDSIHLDIIRDYISDDEYNSLKKELEKSYFTQKEVALLCPTCAKEMQRRGLQTLKKAYFKQILNKLFEFDLHKAGSLEGWVEKMKKHGGEHPFNWCLSQMKDNINNPEGFCAKIHKKAFGKTPMERKAEKKE